MLWFVAAIGVWQLAHVVYPSIWAYYAIAAYGWSAWEIGLSLTAVGVGSAVVQGFLLGKLVPRIGERGAILVGICSILIVTAVFAFVRDERVIYVALLANGLQGLIYPSLNALNSKAVGADSQGELQGATQAVGSIAQIAGPPMYAGIFAQFTGANAIAQFPAMPLVVSAGIAVLAVVLALRGSRRTGTSCT